MGLGACGALAGGVRNSLNTGDRATSMHWFGNVLEGALGGTLLGVTSPAWAPVVAVSWVARKMVKS